MYFWYRFLTYLFYPFAPIYLYFRKIKKKEDSISYKEKLSRIEITREKGFLIWFHVASVGEAMSILPLIESCIEEKKIDKILLTSITLSSGNILKKRFNLNKDIADYDLIDIDGYGYPDKFFPVVFECLKDRSYLVFTFPVVGVNCLNGITEQHFINFWRSNRPTIGDIVGSMVFSDIDGNNDPEVIAATDNGMILIFHLDGAVYENFPINKPFAYFYSS